MVREAGMPRDSLWRKYRRWQGVFLIAASLVATVWLAATNQLILYINPRYVGFTVIMAVIGLVLVVASFIDRADHDHEEKPTALKTVMAVAATALTLGVAVALVVVPPATLTTATADQRVMNSVNVGSSTATVASSGSASSAASAKFTVLDWSTLLRQTSNSSFYAGKAVDVVGFVTGDPDDPSNMFYLSRFVITCCAVDAQPVGVPVYLAGWKSHYKGNEWVHITGQFVTNPSRKSEQSIALIPRKTSKVKQPSEPYLY
jgi:putative membrane protein